MKIFIFCNIKEITCKEHFFQDYPSFGQILQKARENNVNILFVIGGNDNAYIRSVYYDNMATLLPGGIDQASALNTDASNILNIVGDSFRVTKNETLLYQNAQLDSSLQHFPASLPAILNV
jgi:hypothetical protein